MLERLTSSDGSAGGCTGADRGGNWGADCLEWDLMLLWRSHSRWKMTQLIFLPFCRKETLGWGFFKISSKSFKIIKSWSVLEVFDIYCRYPACIVVIMIWCQFNVKIFNVLIIPWTIYFRTVMDTHMHLWDDKCSTFKNKYTVNLIICRNSRIDAQI